MWLEAFGDIDVLVFYIFAAFSFLILVVGVAAILVPCCVPHATAYLPGGTMDFNVIVGGRLIVLTVLIQGILPEWAKESSLNVLCQFYPAALLIGLTLFIGGLLVKGVTLYVYKWHKRPTAVSSEWKPNLAVWGILIITGILSIIWCLLFTPTLAEVSSHRYICYSRNADFEWKVATSVLHGILLIIALIFVPLQCKRSRDVPSSPESTALTLAVLNTVFCVVAGVCVHFLYSGGPTEMYAIKGGLRLWMVLLTDVVMLAAKVIVAKKEAKNREIESDEDESYDVIKEESESGEPKDTGTTETREEADQ